MRKQPDLLVFSCLFVLLMVGCGQRSSPALTKDVGTDLNGHGLSYMYWVEGHLAVQGSCRPFEPITRINCNQTIKTLPYAEFESKILTPVSNQIASAKRKADAWLAEFSAVDNRLRSDPSNPNIQAEWRYAKRQLEIAQEELVLAERSRNDAFEALHLVKDNYVTYRVTSENSRYESVRSIVASFYYIFNSTPQPPVPPPFRAQWVDPDTGKTWALVEDQMSWRDASDACQRRIGWRLPSSFQDFNSGDGSNLDVANRLFASDVGSSLIHLPYKPVSGGSEFQAKVVWTSDYTPSSSYGALLYVYANIEGHGIMRSLHLLSSNSRYTAVCVKD